MIYASVIIPVPVAGTFTYSVPAELEPVIRTGMRVIVPFGARHYYTGIVDSLSPVRPLDIPELKEVSMCLDDQPIVRFPQLNFWRWMADYYMCSLGEVYKAALPAALKIESETRVSICEDNPEAYADCSRDEIELLDAVRRKESVAISDLGRASTTAATQRIVARLLERGILRVSEKLIERYSTVRKPYIRLLIPKGDNVAVAAAFEALTRSKKQQQALVAVLALTEFNRPDVHIGEIPLQAVLEKTGLTRANLTPLASKGYIEIFNKEISRFTYSGRTGVGLPELSPAQKKALAELHDSFNTHDITLFHGVTSSGKTEVYAHLIDFVLCQGKQALMLVPEIALTTQLTVRLQKIFGDRILIYHSRFSDNERVELWRRLLNSSEPMVILGARSAIFLPFAKLGIVIVDEEHEPSYKQYDPAPRYNARDAASVLARMHGAKTVFGSATPAIETYYKAHTGMFGLVSLGERYGNVELPGVEIVDMRARSPHRTSPFFSDRLVSLVNSSTDNKRQAILFHNRRGYAPSATCTVCGFTMMCDRCDVALTYHRRRDRLQCHYCGTEYPVPGICPNCHQPTMEIRGFGTERLEDELDNTFPGRRVLRLDLDTTRNKEAYSDIIDTFSAGKADILVGTQMVTKGLDFGGVDTVGIISADKLINIPDFRSAERAFNLMEQVAGRAGRRGDKGTVVIQTYRPDHPLLKFVRDHDYAGYYEHELEERRQFVYPPFCRIINVYVRHRDAKEASSAASTLAVSFRSVVSAEMVLGPQEPPVARVNNQYIRKIMLKLPPGASPAAFKASVMEIVDKLRSSLLSRSLVVYYDVDPV